MKRDYVVEFVIRKITDTERTIKARVSMEEVWASGTDASWRTARCFKSKSERLKESAMHGRIAEKHRHELKMFKQVLDRLQTTTPK